MSDFDAIVADMDIALLDTFGEDATVQRGTDAPVPVRVSVLRNVQRVGEFGQVIDRVSTATFRNAEWQPQRGDVLVYSTGTKAVDSIDSDDGFLTVAVLHG